MSVISNHKIYFTTLKRINNGDVQSRTGMVRKLSERVDTWVMRPRGRPNYGCMGGVKQKFGKIDIRVKLAKERGMDRWE